MTITNTGLVSNIVIGNIKLLGCGCLMCWHFELIIKPMNTLERAPTSKPAPFSTLFWWAKDRTGYTCHNPPAKWANSLTFTCVPGHKITALSSNVIYHSPKPPGDLGAVATRPNIVLQTTFIHCLGMLHVKNSWYLQKGRARLNHADIQDWQIFKECTLVPWTSHPK